LRHGMQEEPVMRAPYFRPETDAGNDVLLAHTGAGEKRKRSLNELRC
jgi:hypothetical protein